MEDWFDEFAGMANIINRFAGIPLDELRGTRVPFLRVGWNTQFIMVIIIDCFCRFVIVVNLIADERVRILV